MRLYLLNEAYWGEQKTLADLRPMLTPFLADHDFRRMKKATIADARADGYVPDETLDDLEARIDDTSTDKFYLQDSKRKPVAGRGFYFTINILV